MTARGGTDHRKIQLYLAPTPVPPLTAPWALGECEIRPAGTCRIPSWTRALGWTLPTLWASYYPQHRRPRPGHEPLPPLPPPNHNQPRWRHPRALARRRNIGLPVDGVPPVDSPKIPQKGGSGPMFATKEGPGRADHRSPKIVWAGE